MMEAKSRVAHHFRMLTEGSTTALPLAPQNANRTCTQQLASQSVRRRQDRAAVAAAAAGGELRPRRSLQEDRSSLEESSSHHQSSSGSGGSRRQRRRLSSDAADGGAGRRTDSASDSPMDDTGATVISGGRDEPAATSSGAWSGRARVEKRGGGVGSQPWSPEAVAAAAAQHHGWNAAPHLAFPAAQQQQQPFPMPPAWPPLPTLHQPFGVTTAAGGGTAPHLMQHAQPSSAGGGSAGMLHVPNPFSETPRFFLGANGAAVPRTSATGGGGHPFYQNLHGQSADIRSAPMIDEQAAGGMTPHAAAGPGADLLPLLFDPANPWTAEDGATFDGDEGWAEMARELLMGGAGAGQPGGDGAGPPSDQGPPGFGDGRWSGQIISGLRANLAAPPRPAAGAAAPPRPAAAAAAAATPAAALLLHRSYVAALLGACAAAPPSSSRGAGVPTWAASAATAPHTPRPFEQVPPPPAAADSGGRSGGSGGGRAAAWGSRLVYSTRLGRPTTVVVPSAATAAFAHRAAGDEAAWLGTRLAADNMGRSSGGHSAAHWLLPPVPSAALPVARGR